jgi:hypothetical protein
MADPFDCWLGAAQPLDVFTPKTGDSFDTWVTVLTPFWAYVKAAVKGLLMILEQHADGGGLL